MRPFDANLVIAIVQDQARLNASAAEVPPDLSERLRVIPQSALVPEVGGGIEFADAVRSDRAVGLGTAAVVSLALGLAGLIALVAWLLGG